MKIIKSDDMVLCNPIGLDRGYSGFQNVNYAAAIGMFHHGCIQASQSPFAAVTAKSPGDRFKVSEIGYAGAHYSSSRA
jgi:hypothetical protein